MIHLNQNCRTKILKYCFGNTGTRKVYEVSKTLDLKNNKKQSNFELNHAVRKQIIITFCSK